MIAHALATVDASPFHDGEMRIQSALGVREEIEAFARRVVRPFLPEQHARFYSQLPFLVAAARDARGRPWATILAGAPGFVCSPDDRSLEIAARPGSGDALGGALASGADLGLLGIELHSRRRNRVNGRVRAHGERGLVFDVDQTFGNCPQHIHERRWSPARVLTQPARPVRTGSLSMPQQRAIEGADTFFIATGHRGSGEDASFGMDASHRGGAVGFVEVEGPTQLVFPDYAGNNHFNTLGNLLLEPRAGLLFVDFEGGGLLQLTGRAEIDWREPDAKRHPDARRWVRFEVEEVVEQRGVLPLRWSREGVDDRRVRLVERVMESEDVVSFHFADASGRALETWAPGQHLPVELAVEPGEPAIVRTYSLSNAPGSETYRISVKREPRGRVSRALHEGLELGSELIVRAPAGDFGLDLERVSSDRPVVLVAAGIGITPLASILHALVEVRHDGPVVLVHGVRDGDHHPLAKELREAIAKLADGRMHVRYSRPGAGDEQGRDYDRAGRVDADLVRHLAPGPEAEFFLCGPAAFMGDIQRGLEDLGVAADRIHFERF